MNNIFDKYRIFDIDPSKLRSKNFYANLEKERNSYWEIRKKLIKEDKDTVCLLCNSNDNNFLLSYKEYKVFKCKNCGAAFPNIKFDEEYRSLVYEDKIYEDKIKREILSTYEYRKNTFGTERWQYIQKQIKFDIKSDNLLDIGCGAGYFLKHLKEQGVKSKGLEITQYLVDICKDKKLDVDSIMLEDENNLYSVITMFDVLEHLISPIEFFRTAYNKLKSDGHIVAYTPNINSFAFHFQEGKQNLLLPYEHVLFYDISSLNYLAKESGFEIKSIEYFGLDIIDYFCMKEHEDGVSYNKNLKDIIPYLQALIDHEKISNHMRIVFKKIKSS